jgi:hypothetical protein
MLEKQNPLKSEVLRRAARDNICVRCFRGNSTVGCHYTGLRQHDYGKGKGIKCTDLAIADLCNDCHRYFDVDIVYKSIDKSEEFLHCIMLTIIRRHKEGIIKIET